MTVPSVVLHAAAVAGLAEAFAAVSGIDLIEVETDDEVHDALSRGAEILVTYKWRPDFLVPSLRWVQGIGAGYEQYPLDVFDRNDIAFTTATGVHVAVAEGAFGLMLALTRRIGQAVRDAQTRTWLSREGPEIAGSTIGILGLGTIGEAFAQRTQGWDVDLIGYKRHPESYTGVVPTVLGPGDLIEVCRRSDILVIAMPGSPETTHLIGAEELAALGAGWLVNVGRGSVVDEAALIEALTEGELLGAGLDVFEQEPLPTDSPLWALDNVVVTPHSAGNTPRYGERLAAIFDQNLRAFRGESVAWRNKVVDG